jgi:hypothetical protein
MAKNEGDLDSTDLAPTVGVPGAIAQLGERLDRTQEVGGSSPPSSIVGRRIVCHVSRRPQNMN